MIPLIEKVIFTLRIELNVSVKIATRNFEERRLRVVDSAFFKLSEDVRRIKEESIENLDKLLEKATKSLKRNGFQVYHAKDVREARKIAEEFFEDCDLIVKSKSNVAHEVGIKEHLKAIGKEVWETDLGDLIIQLSNDSPRHFTMPAIHISAKEAMKLFEVNSIEDLKRKAREILREKIIKADGGITGANVVSADGSVFLIENEGNVRLVSSFPRKHLIFTGVEKIVGSFEDAVKVAKLTWMSAGYKTTSYLNVISGISKSGDVEKNVIYGLHGPEELGIVFVDNGRMRARDSEFREALYCLRCGACLFSCPTYIVLNADWGSIYHGGIGVIWDYITGRDFEPFLCVGCAKCREICPLRINIPEMIRKLRGLKLSE